MQERNYSHSVCVAFYCSVISRNWTSKSLIGVEFLDFVSARSKLFFSSGNFIGTEISLEIETKYVHGSNASNLKEKVEGKVSKRLSYFRDLSKKVDPKVV